MNIYEFVLLIVLIVTVGRLVERKVARRHQREASGKSEADLGTPSKLEDLEQRVQVLERIVTDQGYELRQKFRDLDG
jgi:Na+-transporting methylmalonyl-CoA/oxaloacetate decarboxylase gamma subunit